ncbi:MAG: DedA family protein [Candidatus Binatia bacterium]
MLEELIARYGYLAVLGGTFLEGETILVLAGFLAHRGLLWLPGVMLAAFVGSLASDQLFFYLGRRHGAAMLAKRPQWQPAAERVRRLLARYNVALTLSFRFLYGLRNVTPVVLGMSDISTARFVVLNAIGAALWAVAVAALGWFVGSAAKQLLGHLERYEARVAAAIIAIGVVLWIWHHLAARRRGRAAAATD